MYFVIYIQFFPIVSEGRGWRCRRCWHKRDHWVMNNSSCKLKLLWKNFTLATENSVEVSRMRSHENLPLFFKSQVRAISIATIYVLEETMVRSLLGAPSSRVSRRSCTGKYVFRVSIDFAILLGEEDHLPFFFFIIRPIYEIIFSITPLTRFTLVVQWFKPTGMKRVSLTWF